MVAWPMIARQYVARKHAFEDLHRSGLGSGFGLGYGLGTCTGEPGPAAPPRPPRYLSRTRAARAVPRRSGSSGSSDRDGGSVPLSGSKRSKGSRRAASSSVRPRCWPRMHTAWVGVGVGVARGRGRGEVKGSGEGVGERGWGKGFGFGVHAACTTKPIAASARKVGSSAAHAPG